MSEEKEDRVAEISSKRQRVRGGLRLLRYGLVGLIILLLGLFFATGAYRWVSLEALVENSAALRSLVTARPVAAIALYLGLFAVLATLSIPIAALFSVAGGFLFGWPLGGALAIAGASAGAASIFLIARTSLGEPILRRAGPRLQGIATSFQADSFAYLLFLRLLPVMPFWVTNLAAALFGMRFRTFLAATIIGLVPVMYAFAVAGSGLDAAIMAHDQAVKGCVGAGEVGCASDFHPEALLTPQILIALGALGILALGPVVVRTWRARRRGAER